MTIAMRNAAKWLGVGVLSASGALVFACGGGSSEGGGGTTPSATVTTPASQTSQPATSAAASATPTQTAAPMPPPLVVVAMKLTGPKMKGSIEIKDDGSIVGPDGKAVAKIIGAELQDKDGKTLISVGSDGAVKFAGGQHGAKFDAKDDLVVDSGAKFQIGDDGVVKLVNEDGKLDKDSGKMKLVGFKPTARRAAAVFVLGMLMPSAAPTAGVVATATPAVTAPPAKK